MRIINKTISIIMKQLKKNFNRITQVRNCKLCKNNKNCEKCKNKKKMIQINLIAGKHNCICISKKYINHKAKLEFMCLSKGHKWTSKIYNKYYICKKCTKERTLLNILEKIKKKYNYICFQGDDLKKEQLFVCNKKIHMWYSHIKKIKNFKVCQICKNENKMTIKKIKEIAKKRGGKCLSKKYKGVKFHLRWKCYLGHRWSASLKNVFKNGTWCPKCNINIGEEITRNIFNILFKDKFIKIRPSFLNGLEYDGYSEKYKIAFEYDGIQHYKFIKHFHKTKDGFKKRCEMDKLKNKLSEKNGIKLLRIPYNIKYDELKNYVLKLCKKNNINVPNNIEIDYTKFIDVYTIKQEKFKKLKKLVENKGGKLMIDIYVDCQYKFNVECKNHHIFETCASSIVQGYWCKICSKQKKNKIYVTQLAEKYKGKCLSNIYISARERLKWMCKKKHIFYKTPEYIKTTGN